MDNQLSDLIHIFDLRPKTYYLRFSRDHCYTKTVFSGTHEECRAQLLSLTEGRRDFTSNLRCMLFSSYARTMFLKDGGYLWIANNTEEEKW